MRLAGRKGNGERRGAAGGERDREKGVRTYHTSVSVGVSYSPTDAAHWSPKKKGRAQSVPLLLSSLGTSPPGAIHKNL